MIGEPLANGAQKGGFSARHVAYAKRHTVRIGALCNDDLEDLIEHLPTVETFSEEETERMVGALGRYSTSATDTPSIEG